MKILNSIWFTEFGTYIPIGIVVVENEVGKCKTYVGTGHGISQQEDEKKIAETGAKLRPEMLAALGHWLAHALQEEG